MTNTTLAAPARRILAFISLGIQWGPGSYRQARFALVADHGTPWPKHEADITVTQIAGRISAEAFTLDAEGLPVRATLPAGETNAWRIAAVVGQILDVAVVDVHGQPVGPPIAA